VKILYLDQTGELGGAELSLFSEVTNLPHEAAVLLFADGPLRELFARAGVPVEVLAASAAVLGLRRGGGLASALRALPALGSLVRAVARRARNHDLIYANSQKAFVIGALASAISGRPVVWRLRDVLEASHFSLLFRRAAVLLANRRASKVIVNSEATAEAFVKSGGNAGLVAVAYPGIEQARFADLPAHAVAAMRLQLGPGPLIGVFGRLAAWKGQMVFAEALAELPGAAGVIVGAPLFGEEAFAAELHARILALGLAGRVRLLGFREDIPALMSAMDVIVHCSTAPEPFGRVVVEAMLAGRPVVASNAGGIKEIIEHGKTGFLVKPGDAAALCACLHGVLANEDESAAIAAAGQAWARQKFTVAAMVGQIAAALPVCAPQPKSRRQKHG
jgi:glycosyltransferase involved in cell wall biosynthesis